MKVTPIRTFLLRQNDLGGGKKEDVIARKGVKIDVTDSEHNRLHTGYFLEPAPFRKKRGVTVG